MILWICKKLSLSWLQRPAVFQWRQAPFCSCTDRTVLQKWNRSKTRSAQSQRIHSGWNWTLLQPRAEGENLAPLPHSSYATSNTITALCKKQLTSGECTVPNHFTPRLTVNAFFSGKSSEFLADELQDKTSAVTPGNKLIVVMGVPKKQPLLCSRAVCNAKEPCRHMSINAKLDLEVDKV